MSFFLDPTYPHKYILRPSPIHGTGVFATSWINTGDCVEKSVEKNRGKTKYTPFGYHLNHCSTNFNVILKEKKKGEYWNYAIQPIRPDEEITTNYDRDSSVFPDVVGPSEPFYKLC
jgi:hypothetical protein